MESGELEKAGAVEKEVKAEKSVPEFCISIAENVLCVAGTGEKRKLKR